MLPSLEKVSKVDASFLAIETELLQSSARSLIYTTCALSFLALMSTAARPDQLANGVWASVPIVLLTCVLTWRLLDCHFALSQVVWQIGISLAISVAIHVFQQPFLVFLLALLPLMAVATLGLPGFTISQALVMASVVWLSIGASPPLPVSLAVGTLAAGLLTGAVGWSSSKALLTATDWSLFSYQQARLNLEEARERRAELARVLHDLDKAYYSLDRANNMLVLARAEAEEARDARNRLVLAISHELRTPLNFIIGFSELMVKSPNTYAPLRNWPAGLYEDVEEIYRSSSHLERLVNDVLALGQIDSLQMTLFRQRTDPLAIVREVEKMVRPAFAQKKLVFQVEVEADLPDIHVDATRIRQVLLNLVSNGLRVTDHGGVRIHLQRVGDELEFCVRDTGPGIAQKDITRIFGEFVQAGDNSWRRHEGGGLGLPISKRFIDLHGGQMRVDSQIGKGSSFYFTIPLAATREATDEDGERTRHGSAYWKALEQKARDERLVLALASDQAAADALNRYVDKATIVAVDSAADVRTLVTELLPRAVFVDRSLTLEQEDEDILASLSADVPIISFPFPGNPQRPGSLPEGVARYLVKPIARTALIEAIDALGVDIRRLLVVDDDPAMLRFVQRALKSTAASAPRRRMLLSTALTGTEALQQLQRDSPDVVLLDLSLPDMSGWDVLEELRAKHIPAILITAHDYPGAIRPSPRDTLRITMQRPLTRHELSSLLDFLLTTIRPAYPARPGAAGRSANPPD